MESALETDRSEWPVLLADDFHILDKEVRLEVGNRLKRISDTIFERHATPKLILVGIPAAGTSILANVRDLGPRLGSYRIERASDQEIGRLIDEGEAELNILIEDRDIILSESSGSFWLAQYIKICATCDIHERKTDVTIVQFDLLDIGRRLMSELSGRFMDVAVSFAKGKKWRPGGNKPYLEVLLAISKLPGLVIPFDNVLNVVPERRRPGIKAIQPRLREVLYDEKKGIDLRKQIAFEEPSFSIEDPLFRYFLSNLSASDLYKALGISEGLIQVEPAYAYDVGFSFAGESRKLVEFVNKELQSEDVVTFYDYDHQAFLLAEDLEEVLQRLYSASCRYYLVFLE